MSEMTLDDAIDAFRDDPNAMTAIVYFETAEEYYGAEMIGDATMQAARDAVAPWMPFRPLVEYLDGTADPDVRHPA